MNQRDNLCEECKSYLSGYIEGDLSLTMEKGVDKHLDACPECRDTADKMKVVKSYLNDLPALTTSAAFEQGLRRKVQNTSPRKRSMQWMWGNGTSNWRMPAIGFAVILMLSVSTMVFRGDPTSGDVSQPQESSFSAPIPSAGDDIIRSNSTTDQIPEALGTVESDSLRDARKKKLQQNMKFVNEKK